MNENTRREMENMARNMPTVPLNLTIARQAFAHGRAASLIDKEVAEVFKQPNITDERVAMIQSALLLKSFAVELLLKCLLIIDQDDVFTIDDIKRKGIRIPQKHDFLSLFDAVPDHYRREIVKEYQRVDPAVKDVDAVRERITRIGEHAFVYWRYIYEKPGHHFFEYDELERLLKAVSDCILRLKRGRPDI